VGDASGVDKTTRIDMGTGTDVIENDPHTLEEFVEALEGELDAEIAELDSVYTPNEDEPSDDDLDTDVDKINEQETDNLITDSVREQSTADMDDDEPDNDVEINNDVPDDDDLPAPLPRL
jgi:hypothetical protein